MRTTENLLAVLCLLVAACGGAGTTPTSPETAKTAWKDMTGSQKAVFMEKQVVPKMGGVFSQFDPKQFEKVTCKTCHGARAKSGDFKMPNPDLPKLSTAGGFKKHLDAKPEMTKFMMEKVVPDMAGILGMPPYNPETHQGFGCFGCHTEEK